MSYTLKNIYTRPNAETSVDFWQANLLTVIDTYFDAGKITQKPTKTVDGLTETWTTIFKDKASFDEFAAEDVAKDNVNDMAIHCENNKISWNMVDKNDNDILIT